MENINQTYIDCLVNENAFETKKNEETRQQVVDKIRSAFKEWCPEGELVALGSYKLGVHFPESDIDLLCVAPKWVTRLSFQQEFLDILLGLSGTSYCYGVFRAKVPIIKLTCDSIDLDVLFANFDGNLLEDGGIEYCDDATLLSLNGFRNNEMILQLVPDVGSFQTALRGVKLWAVKKGIYSNILGYLGGATWAILVAKICMTFPDLSPAELVLKFFKIFALWTWEVPVCLSGNNHSQDYSYMTIVTPAQPVFNTAYTLTYSGFQVILKELELAAKVCEDISTGAATWEDLFSEVDFFQEFYWMLQVEVLAVNLSTFKTWLGLVQSRIKYFAKDIEAEHSKLRTTLYTKLFQTESKKFPFSSSYFIGLLFPNTTQKIDFRNAVKNFCETMREINPLTGQCDICIRLKNRNQLEPKVLSQLKV